MIKIAKTELEKNYTNNLQLRTSINAYERYRYLMNNIYSRYYDKLIPTDDLNHNIHLLVSEYGRDSFEVLVYILRNSSGLFKIDEIMYVRNIILINLEIFLPELCRINKIDHIFSKAKLIINISIKDQKLTRFLTTIGNLEKDMKRNINNYELYYSQISSEDILIIEYQLFNEYGNEIKNNQYRINHDIPIEKKDDLNARMDKIFDNINKIDRRILVLEHIT